MTNPDEAGAPPRIAGFTYLRDIGSGGSARVYLYEQQMPRREVAVKVLTAPGKDKRFETEANLMARVSTHPAILSINEVGETADGRSFLVMEYCPPPSLSAMIARAPLSVAEALSITIQIAGAVETAHRAGIIHRDIKPANILFTGYGRPVLSDFGISADASPQGAGELRGMSVPWAPPEQLIGSREAKPASDVYSLAATTFAMLTGRSPYELPGGDNSVLELSRRVVKNPLPSIGRQDAPPSLQRVLSIAMGKKPEQRYSSALTFARALQQVEAEMNLPITTVDVLRGVGRDGAAEPSAEVDDGATRFGVYSLIEPDLAAGGRQRIDSQDEDAIEDTKDGPDVLASSARTAHPSQPSQPQAGGSRLVTGLVGLALVVTLVVAGIALLKGGHGSSTGTHADPLRTIAPGVGTSSAEVPVPRNLAGTVQEDGTVLFTWEEPVAGWQGSYLYRQDVAGQEHDLAPVREESVTVPRDVGRTCVEVYSVQLNGKASSPATACVETP